MDLLFGTSVVEPGKRLGRLAGVEIDPTARRVTRVVVSRDGRLGAHAVTRPIEIVRVEGGKITIAGVPPASAPLPAGVEPVLWSPGTHVVQQGVEIGHPLGVRLEEGNGRVQVVLMRKGRWGKRQELSIDRLDLSVTGELRLGGNTRAA